jgi:hypothetical protein
MIRKGATPAQAGRRVVIPFNMRDGLAQPLPDQGQGDPGRGPRSLQGHGAHSGEHRADGGRGRAGQAGLQLQGRGRKRQRARPGSAAAWMPPQVPRAESLRDSAAAWTPPGRALRSYLRTPARPGGYPLRSLARRCGVRAAALGGHPWPPHDGATAAMRSFTLATIKDCSARAKGVVCCAINSLVIAALGLSL